MSEQPNDVSWALKLLDHDSTYEPNLIAKYFHELYCGMLGGAVPALGNLLYRRPIWAGMQNIILGLAIGGGIGHYLKIREEGILATRDATYRDYIIRHPEDFPPPDRKKFGEVFHPWLPLR
ncbi:NADH dehydrogenase [ubiquinone] 1 subunit C2 [Microplitis demolitor]|uniref:NADH dehydrogenase [ubiquinone] 1 subunit C2 n=1 Tax=Microplitis demolitor TaxID=69319 RepID=UPI0004CDA7A8|nr:NADH dehydrogenase [ubiquinone] 1 subunit C2 [Microplitis demolitor]